VKENINASLVIEGVLLTMADFRTNLTNEVINEVREFFKGRVYDTIIPRNIKLTEAPGFGKPIALYDKSSLGAQKYQEFTNELLGVKKDNSSNILNNNELSNATQTEVK
jgi:chromosome partitioning protein